MCLCEHGTDSCQWLWTQVPKVRWDDVGGLEGVKQGLKEAVQWPHLHPDALARLGAQPPTGTKLLEGCTTCTLHSYNVKQTPLDCESSFVTKYTLLYQERKFYKSAARLDKCFVALQPMPVGLMLERHEESQHPCHEEKLYRLPSHWQ